MNRMENKIKKTQREKKENLKSLREVCVETGVKLVYFQELNLFKESIFWKIWSWTAGVLFLQERLYLEGYRKIKYAKILNLDTNKIRIVEI